jgi:hypothetical protein
MGGLMRRAAVAGGAAVMLLGPAAGVFGAAGAKAGTRPAAGARAVISTAAGGVGGPAPATSVSAGGRAPRCSYVKPPGQHGRAKSAG